MDPYLLKSMLKQSKTNIDKYIEETFDHHPPITDEIIQLHTVIRTVIKKTAYALIEHVPEGKELSIALRHLEEVMFWSNAGIARKLSIIPKPTQMFKSKEKKEKNAT